MIPTKEIEARLAPFIEKYGEGSDELWTEKLKVESEFGMMLFKRPICICPAELHFIDDRRHEAAEQFTITAKSRCPFRGDGFFRAPETFLDLYVHDILVGKKAKSMMPTHSEKLRLRAFTKFTPLYTGWLLDTIDGRSDENCSIVLSSDVAVEHVRFTIEGRAMPLDVYDDKKFWRVTRPSGAYDATAQVPT